MTRRTLHDVDAELIAAMDRRDAGRVDVLLAERALLLTGAGVQLPPPPDVPLPAAVADVQALGESVDRLLTALRRAGELFTLATPFGDQPRIVKSNFGHPDALFKGLFRAAYDDGREHCLRAQREAEALHERFPDLPRAPIPEPEDITGRVPFARDVYNARAYLRGVNAAIEVYRTVWEAAYRRVMAGR